MALGTSEYVAEDSPDGRLMTFPAGSEPDDVNCPDCGVGVLREGGWCPAYNSTGPEIGPRYYCTDCGQCWALGAELLTRIDVPECKVCPFRTQRGADSDDQRDAGD